MTAPVRKPPGTRDGKKTVKPIKIGAGRNWAAIAVFAAVTLLAVGIIGWGVWAVYRPGSAGYSWQTRIGQIDGVADYRSGKDLARDHVQGVRTYEQSPAVGGAHNGIWQRCTGNVYQAAIANEHATHSLEHGAVWITYRQGLPAAQVTALAAKVQGRDYMLMSPVAELGTAVSLQGWGYQLSTDDVADPRIDDFISALRVNASMEPGAPCSGGNTFTGTAPLTPEQAQRLIGQGD
ncbi:DUF3105 domain-containing protein [Catellatospora methionotrophica]|uniref:DUF3105 domain-containing protein n=1 Tax=Catellatospora methionotrophica TaxID=121620 RepID=UPI0033F4D5A9